MLSMETEPPSSSPSPNPPKQPEEVQEPIPKKLKMSTTSDDDDLTAVVSEDGSIIQKKSKYKRRKIAIFFAYCGVGYQGMQKNPGAKTIEGDLEEALFQAGAIPEQDRGCPKRVDWARSARTDKGVSAVGQVVSGKFYIDPPGFVERLNSVLPSLFRVFGYKRVTASFSAKKFCDRRRYVYLIPVFALDKNCHRDRESVVASLGSGNELVKCLECSERGRKVEGIMGKRSPDFSCLSDDNKTVDSSISSNTCDAQMQLMKEAEGTNSSANPNDNKDYNNIGNAIVIDSDNDTTEIQKMDGGKSEGDNENTGAQTVVPRDFSYGDKEKKRLNRILKLYEGTHNFHNFTTRIKAEDPSAQRYIISFQADATVNVDGIDFVKCEVVGQSFMLHQIRKMIGLAVSIMRDCAPEELIETAFQKNVNITVPMAPEVGLYLDECFFSSYNKKWKDTHEEVSMNSYAAEAEDFKMKYIYSHIAATEHKEGVAALWLHSLNYRNYPDLCYLSNRLKSDGGVEDESKCSKSDGAVEGVENESNCLKSDGVVEVEDPTVDE